VRFGHFKVGLASRILTAILASMAGNKLNSRLRSLVVAWRPVRAASVAWMLASAFLRVESAEVPELSLPRPGTVMVGEITGTVTSIAGDQRKSVKPDERLRVGSTVTTGRRSVATLRFSNGAMVQLGADSELEIEEFGQAPFSGSTKFAELKEDPSLSKTKLRLLRGDVAIIVKPLKVNRGSSFTLTLLGGTVQTGDASFRAWVQMSDLGLGVCNVELQRGSAQFEPLGRPVVPLVEGRKLTFAIEQDKAGVVKLSDMPAEPAAAKK
jgi:hypothetical protein